MNSEQQSQNIPPPPPPPPPPTQLSGSDQTLPEANTNAPNSLQNMVPNIVHNIVSNTIPNTIPNTISNTMQNTMQNTMTNTMQNTMTNVFPSAESAPQLAPNRTLYVKNLNCKIKLDQLKRDLRGIFENFGVVQEVIAMSSFWRKGQAWIVFADQASADKALTQLQRFPYAKKEMIIQYARDLSDIVAKEKGVFKPRPAGPKKPRAILEKEQKLQFQLQQFQQMMLRYMQQKPNAFGGATSNNMTQLPANIIPPQLNAFFFPNQTPAPPAAGVMPPMPPQAQQRNLMNANTNHSQPAPVFPLKLPQQQQQPSHPPLQQAIRPGLMQNSAVGGGAPGVQFTPQPNTGAFNSQPVEGTTQPMTKDAMVVAAATAAALAVEAAARKRTAENESRNVGNKMPRMTMMPIPQQPVNDMYNRMQPAIPPMQHKFMPNMGMPPVPGMNFSGNPQPKRPAPPNKTLFVEQLPENCETKALEELFKKHPGCLEVRHVPSRKVAFVDYETVAQANIALRFLSNQPFMDSVLRISYAR